MSSQQRPASSRTQPLARRPPPAHKTLTLILLFQFSPSSRTFLPHGRGSVVTAGPLSPRATLRLTERGRCCGRTGASTQPSSGTPFCRLRLSDERRWTFHAPLLPPLSHLYAPSCRPLVPNSAFLAFPHAAVDGRACTETHCCSAKWASPWRHGDKALIQRCFEAHAGRCASSTRSHPQRRSKPGAHLGDVG